MTISKVCTCGGTLLERSRETRTEVRESVIYNKQKIKHFDREGSEFWTEISVPDLVEETSYLNVLTLICSDCGTLTEITEPRL